MAISTLCLAAACGLILVLTWICLMPLRDLGKMDEATRKSPLTKLYVGVWLYVLLYGFLETMFFLSTGFVWFSSSLP